MSNEDTIIPIKLAQRFIHIIDFHADPVTCVSASSGTVSYDSIQSPRHGRSDLIMQQDAIHCIRQPPRPHHISKIRKVFKNELLVKPVPVSSDEFRAAQIEHLNRKSEVGSYTKSFNEFGGVSKELDLAMKECLVNFKKSENDETKKSVYDITIEFPSSTSADSPKEKFVISQKTLTKSLSSRIMNSFESDLNGHQLVGAAFEMLS